MLKIKQNKELLNLTQPQRKIQFSELSHILSSLFVFEHVYEFLCLATHTLSLQLLQLKQNLVHNGSPEHVQGHQPLFTGRQEPGILNSPETFIRKIQKAGAHQIFPKQEASGTGTSRGKHINPACMHQENKGIYPSLSSY